MDMDMDLEKRIKDKLNEIAEVKATELRDKEVAFLVDHMRRLETERCYEEAKIQWSKARPLEVSEP